VAISRAIARPHFLRQDLEFNALRNSRHCREWVDFLVPGIDPRHSPADLATGRDVPKHCLDVPEPYPAGLRRCPGDRESVNDRVSVIDRERCRADPVNDPELVIDRVSVIDP
jgi:hypothetical protein